MPALAAFGLHGPYRVNPLQPLEKRLICGQQGRQVQNLESSQRVAPEVGG